MDLGGGGLRRGGGVLEGVDSEGTFFGVDLQETYSCYERPPLDLQTSRPPAVAFEGTLVSISIRDPLLLAFWRALLRFIATGFHFWTTPQ